MGSKLPDEYPEPQGCIRITGDVKVVWGDDDYAFFVYTAAFTAHFAIFLVLLTITGVI